MYIEQPKEQICKDCGELKPLEEFHKNEKYINGRSKQCRICRKKYDNYRRPLIKKDASNKYAKMYCQLYTWPYDYWQCKELDPKAKIVLCSTTMLACSKELAHFLTIFSYTLPQVYRSYEFLIDYNHTNKGIPVKNVKDQEVLLKYPPVFYMFETAYKIVTVRRKLFWYDRFLLGKEKCDVIENNQYCIFNRSCDSFHRKIIGRVTNES